MLKMFEVLEITGVDVESRMVEDRFIAEAVNDGSVCCSEGHMTHMEARDHGIDLILKGADWLDI